jgi:hypothetical protein
MKELYNITRVLSGKKTAAEKQVKDKNGNIQTTTEEQNHRWKEHFEELLNRPPPETEAEILPADEDLNTSLDPPTKEEIKKAIKTLNNGKSGGPDCIPKEALKSPLETSVKILHPLLKKIWEEENIPNDWKEGYIIKLPKKGDLSLCKNYRGIMLLKNEGISGPGSTRPSGWVEERWILSRPDRYLKNYNRTVIRMEVFFLHQLHRLREGVRHHRQRLIIEDHEALWNS